MSVAASSTNGTALYGVTGWPLAQTLSPLLHNTGFRTLGINALYQKWEVPPEKLPAFVESVRLLDIRGCSVTIPHKVGLWPCWTKSAPLHVRWARPIPFTGRATTFAAKTPMWPDSWLRLQKCLLAGGRAAAGCGRRCPAVAAGLASPKNAKRPARTFVATPSDKSHLPLADDSALRPCCGKTVTSLRPCWWSTPLPLACAARQRMTPHTISRWQGHFPPTVLPRQHPLPTILCTTPSKPVFCARPALLVVAAYRALKCFLVRATRSSASGRAGPAARITPRP